MDFVCDISQKLKDEYEFEVDNLLKVIGKVETNYGNYKRSSNIFGLTKTIFEKGNRAFLKNEDYQNQKWPIENSFQAAEIILDIFKYGHVRQQRAI